MQFSKWKIGAVALVCMLLPGSVHAQIVKNERLLSFEEKQVPAFVTTAAGSQLGISDEHYRDGDHSLSWTFEPGAALSIKKDLKFEKKDPTGKDTYLSAFIVWVYNEQAQDKQIRFEFLKDGKVCTSFPFGINFTGWRGAWVCYERDMQGTPEEGMDEIRIVAPDVKGKLFFDHLITASKVDARQQTADLQVPFVNKGTTNHWLVIYEHSLWKPDIPLTDVAGAQEQDIRSMEKRIRNMLWRGGGGGGAGGRRGRHGGRTSYLFRTSLRGIRTYGTRLGQRYVLQTGDRDKRLFQPDETRRHRLQQCGGCGAETRVGAEIHRHVRQCHRPGYCLWQLLGEYPPLRI